MPNGIDHFLDLLNHNDPHKQPEAGHDEFVHQFALSD